jgi:endonuclease/exonuclease/phosphatase (EEP) superfamily protein YafD
LKYRDTHLRLPALISRSETADLLFQGGTDGDGTSWPQQRFCDHDPMPSRRMEWALATALAGWAAARLAGADRLRFAEAWAVPLLSFTPQVTAGAWASALLLRGGPAATTAAAGAALTVAVGPRAVPSRQPPAAGPTLRVLTANLLLGRAAPESVVELVRRMRPDALFVQELTSEAAARLQRAGLGDLLAHGVAQSMPNGTRGSGIYARYPLRSGLPADSVSVAPVSAGPVSEGPVSEGPLSAAPVSAAPVFVAPVSAARCTARLELPFGQFVQLACIHAGPPRPPWSPGATARWRGQLAALPPPGAGPVILAGDFNATLDHAQFRRLLRRGYADAASQAGQGLVHTWGPRPDWRLTLLAIDHVLVDRRCQVLTTSAHRVAGSDHRALYAELRLPAPEQITAPSTQ